MLSPAITPPNLHLTPYRGELWLEETTTRQLVKVGNKHLVALGIWTAQLRGLPHYVEAVEAADLRPGTPVRLVREPSNGFDTNAIAATSDVGVLGYVNKQMAARLAPLMDSGTKFEAVSLAGDGPGKAESRVHVLAAEPGLLRHLKR